VGVSRTRNTEYATVQDLAAVLHSRLAQWQEHQTPPPPRRVGDSKDSATRALDRLRIIDGSIAPTDPAATAIGEIDALLRSRLAHINVDAITTRPAWMQPLGRLPARNEQAAAGWIDAVSTVAAYRDLFRVYGPQATGTASSSDRTERRQRHIADSAAARATRVNTETYAPSVPPPDHGLTR
jgi:hypothetical protein